MIRRNRWVQRAVLAAIVVALLAGFSAFEHATPLLLPMVLLVGAVVAILGLMIDSAGVVPPVWEISTDKAHPSAGQDGGLSSNVRLLENHLSARVPDPLLRARLVRLTDDRLARAGLRRADPGVADRLGPTLSGVLDGPPRRMRVAEIEECVRRIEELTA